MTSGSTNLAKPKEMNYGRELLMKSMIGRVFLPELRHGFGEYLEDLLHKA